MAHLSRVAHPVREPWKAGKVNLEDPKDVNESRLVDGKDL